MSVLDELWRFVLTDPSLGRYYQPPHRTFDDSWRNTFRDFLFSTMDELRLRRAGAVCQATLKRFDVEDADYFRLAVMRREVSRDIAYPKQRDHSAHTVYNWLLGWYLVAHSKLLADALRAHIDKRALLTGPYEFADVFGDVFQFPSLLHDVGYLFEGSVAAFDAEASARQAATGMSVVRDYFDHRFWRENEITAVADRQWVKAKLELTDVGPSPASTLSGIADSLRYLGELEPLRKAMNSQARAQRIHAGDAIRTEDGLSPDAFQLWRSHFDEFSKDVVPLVDAVEAVFYSHLHVGIDGAGLRILDHAVCSGLLLLQYSTLYFRIFHGLGDSQPPEQRRVAVWKRFRRDEEGVDYQPMFWWRGILWSTAATALHNILQIPAREWPVGAQPPGPLALATEPLTYLGVLVDCLQEWDRYTVQRTSVFGGALPVQGVDVQLAVDAGRAVLRFQKSSGRARKVRQALDDALAGWDQIVCIEEY